MKLKKKIIELENTVNIYRQLFNIEYYNIIGYNYFVCI